MTTNINVIIGRNIRYRRRLYGLTQRAVGQYLSVSFQQIQKYENGTNDISAQKMLRLTIFFQCSLDDLYRDALPESLPHASVPVSDLYRVDFLMAQFNRIPSHAARDKLCWMVKTAADAIAPEQRESL
jgi:transcriptional regulator with XRE-family HTH domain